MNLKQMVTVGVDDAGLERQRRRCCTRWRHGAVIPTVMLAYTTVYTTTCYK